MGRQSNLRARSRSLPRDLEVRVSIIERALGLVERFHEDEDVYARVDQANTFEKGQVIAPGNNATPALLIRMPTGGTNPLMIYNESGETILATVNPQGMTTIGRILYLVPIPGLPPLVAIDASAITDARSQALQNKDGTFAYMADLSAVDAAVVHLAGAETITGNKVFTAPPVFQGDESSADTLFALKDSDSGKTMLYYTALGAWMDDVYRQLQPFEGQELLAGRLTTAAPYKMAAPRLTGQSATIASTKLTDTMPTGHYAVLWSLAVTTLDALAVGTVQLNVIATEPGGSRTQSSMALVLTALGVASGLFAVNLASGNITFTVTGITTIGNARYSLSITPILVGT